MNNIGPKYPFEPLPPPEHPSMRKTEAHELNVEKEAKTETQNRNRIYDVKKPQKADFRQLLAQKTEPIQNPSILSDTEQKEIRKVAQELEAFFMYSILKNFNKTLSQDGLFPKSAGSQMYMEMFFEGVAETMSKVPGGFGLADQIVSFLELRLAE